MVLETSLRQSNTPTMIHQVRGGAIQKRTKRDFLATEEPLEIRLVTPTQSRQVAVTMRTPGADFELAMGFLFSEGIIESANDVHQISYCVDRELSEEQRYNVVNVRLRSEPQHAIESLERHFFINSACGVCGKQSIDLLEQRGLAPLQDESRVSIETISRLDSTLRDAQKIFDKTGGLHAAALFNLRGELIALREDVGRHNALDKLIGYALMQNQLPLHQHILLVSGRASFELVQKAVSAGIPIFCAVSAPSSIAVEVARRFNETLIGFLREDNFNIYCGEKRLFFDEN